MCRSWDSEPLLRSTKRTTVGLLVPAFTVTFFGSNEYSSAPKAIGWLWPAGTLSFFCPPSPLLSSPPPPQPESTSMATTTPGSGFGMAANNMPAHAEAEPLPRLLPRGLRRARPRLRRAQDQRCEQRGSAGPARRAAVQRPLRGLPLAVVGGRVRLEAARQGQGRGAHRRPELQRAQGVARGRAVRDPQRRLLRRDHAREHRGRAGGARRRRLPRALRGREVREVAERASCRARPEGDTPGPRRRARGARAAAGRGPARRAAL